MMKIKILVAINVFLFVAIGVSMVFAAPVPVPATVDSCPATGGGWTKVDSNDLSLYPVPGATNYCFKFGSANSQGCTGGTSNTWPPPVDNPCGLSHWAYFIPVVSSSSSSSSSSESSSSSSESSSSSSESSSSSSESSSSSSESSSSSSSSSEPTCTEGTHLEDGVCVEDPTYCDPADGQIKSIVGPLPEGALPVNHPACNPKGNTHWCQRTETYKPTCIEAAGSGWETFWLSITSLFERLIGSFSR